MFPSLYVSHGSPALSIMENSTTSFLKNLSSNFDEPKFILVVSAHWLTKDLKILYEENPHTIHDFYNFPKELYELKYEAKSDLKKCDEIINLIENSGIKIEKDTSRGGFDHGVWSPLSLIYPNANIPIIQLSLPLNFDSKQLFELGVVLNKLRNDTLIIASGAMTHNIMNSNWEDENAKPTSYAKEFRDWVVKYLQAGDFNTLLDYNKAPYMIQNHPSKEHFFPFYVVLGASSNHIGKSLHDVYMYGNQSMDTILFEK
jgi:4,5-DOPA dioxygenase extradiol